MLAEIKTFNYMQHSQSEENRILSSYPQAAIEMAQQVDNLIIETLDYKRGIATLLRTYDLAGNFRNPQGCKLTGDAGSGRSHLLESFHAALAERGDLKPEAKILQTKLDESITRRSLVSKALGALGYPILDMGAGIESGKQNQLLRMYLKNRCIRLWIIHGADELTTTKVKNTDETINGAKHISALLEGISTELKIPLILVGSNRLESLSHLAPELSAICDLHLKMGDLTEHENWQVLVSGYTHFLEKHFDLAEGVVDNRGLSKIAGFVGKSKLRLSRLIMELVMVSMKEKTTSLSGDSLDKAIAILTCVSIQPREYCK